MNETVSGHYSAAASILGLLFSLFEKSQSFEGSMIRRFGWAFVGKKKPASIKMWFLMRLSYPFCATAQGR